MKPPKQRETGQRDMFRSRLDQIIDLGHPLVKLAGKIDWTFLEQRFGYLAHRSGDAANAVLAAAGYNFRLLLTWLALLGAQILAALAGQLRPQTQLKIT